MEDPSEGERMEKPCLAKERNEQGKGRSVRNFYPGIFLSVERTGEGIAKEIIPLVPLKITFPFHSFHFGILPSLPMKVKRKRGYIFAMETKNKRSLTC